MTTIWRRVLGGALALILLVVAAAAVFFLHPMWVADHQTRFHLWRSGVRSEYVEVDGLRIHYFEALPPNGDAGTPLLLIHGLGARGEDWSPIIPGLAAAGFHVYVPDLLGYGRSPRPPEGDYSISAQEKLVANFMHAVHADRADVAGWSMGGWVAMKMALVDAPMVNRLILFDAAGVYFPGYTSLDQAFDVTDRAGIDHLFSMLSPNPRPIPAFVARDLARRIHNNVWVVKRSMAAMTSGRDLMDFRLYAIKQPTLVVWGKQDALIPLSAGETIHRGIPGSTMLVVDGCGHLTPAECSKVSLEATVTFLRAEPPIQGGERVVSGKQ